MATSRGEGLVFSLLLIFCFCVTSGVCNYRFNMDKCRVCSSNKEVPCYMQHMSYPCFPGHTQDIFTDMNEWPGAARDLSANVDKRNGNLVANFSWKPPYDSSVRSLKGFEIQLTVLEVSSMSFTICFFANITSRNWTDSDHKHNVIFHLDCIESRDPAKITAYITSIPKPVRNHQRQRISITLKGLKNEWRPHIYINITNASVFVRFDFAYPEAKFHEFHLMDDAGSVMNITFLQMPYQNISFYNLPCNSNYSIWVRPLNGNKKQLTDHFVSQSFDVPECFQPSLIQRMVSTERPHLRDLLMIICLPVLLLCVAIVTVLCYCNRDQIKLIAASRLQSYKEPRSTEVVPNNITADTGKSHVILIFYPEDNNMVEVVESLKAVLRGVNGSQIEFVTEESVVSDQISPEYHTLIILTKGMLEYYQIIQNGGMQNGGNCQLHWDKQQNYTAIANSLQVSERYWNSRPPVYLSIFSNINTDWLRELVPRFSDSHFYSLAGEIEANKCLLREADIRKLVQEFHIEETVQLQDLQRISSMEEVVELKNKLRNLQCSINGEPPRNSVMANGRCRSQNQCSCSSEGQQEMTYVDPLQINRPTDFMVRNTYYSPLVHRNQAHSTNGYGIHNGMPNCYHDNKYNYPEKGGCMIYYSNRNDMDRNKISFDSGYKSKSVNEEERIPFIADTSRSQPNVFISPHESDIESLDSECISLSEKMLDINQRNSPMWHQ